MPKKRKVKTAFRVFRRSLKEPEAVARAVGVGFFIGFLPLMGLQFVLAVLIAGFLSANRIVAALATLITNPLTAIPTSFASLWVGDQILPGAIEWPESISELGLSFLWNSSGPIAAAYLTGCAAIAVFAGLAGYILVRTFAFGARRFGSINHK